MSRDPDDDGKCHESGPINHDSLPANIRQLLKINPRHQNQTANSKIPLNQNPSHTYTGGFHEKHHHPGKSVQPRR
jgi:hypothetical protein